MKLGLNLVLGALGLALVLLIINHDRGQTLSLPNDEFARLAYLATLGAVLAAGIVGSHRHIGELIRNLFLWAVIILTLVAGWTWRDQVQDFAGDMIASLDPARPVVLTAGESPEIALRKSLNGHFVTDAQVNGTPVQFLVDTGATTIALSWHDALAIGIDPASLSFSVPITTANGSAMAASVRLERLEIGPIVRTDLRATVAQEGLLEQSLLGMNFISSLSSFELRRNEVIMRD
ncbi:TIGR02281 family clan AA aspartic protease [Pseudohoeflea coraliihabitans]|uniref:TIGR02281 family clan AA aspartic protease n=1 Tax=Pseudohoeflea coraliihabitans TaxID=2860393 RepID=A0ABS6WPZ7_9HYPH|nr:TIGR02281 family clan AA aspartic protease [Pseudohoeflea sp. DP4N28-3]MBW3097990.1 TIGR02281 family clan AA aspartic protease [Pseudohoeflea sp. DP4N28-3]